MNRWLRIVAAVAGTALATACSDSGISPVEPAVGARFSGGYSVGGNEVPPSTTTSTTAAPTPTTNTTTDPVEDPEEEGTGATDGRSGGYSVGGN